MKPNVGNPERILRAVIGILMLTSSVVAPVSLALRVGLFGILGGYMVFTALAGSCLGYRMMGRSTCSMR
ncbi:MAG: DUF2892 domain-containing protein [Kofleriaceae bacterium]